MNRGIRGRRPAHDYWNAGGFTRKKINNKFVAECTVCNVILTNTAKQRLMQHRFVHSLHNKLCNLRKIY